MKSQCHLKKMLQMHKNVLQFIYDAMKVWKTGAMYFKDSLKNEVGWNHE